MPLADRWAPAAAAAPGAAEPEDGSARPAHTSRRSTDGSLGSHGLLVARGSWEAREARQPLQDTPTHTLSPRQCPPSPHPSVSQLAWFRCRGREPQPRPQLEAGSCRGVRLSESRERLTRALCTNGSTSGNVILQQPVLHLHLEDNYAGMLTGPVAIGAGSEASERPFLGHCYTHGFSAATEKGDIYLRVPVRQDAGSIVT